jgi:CheY-like chemotaxis protein
MMKGNIGVRSDEGRGATFWFTANLEKQPKRKTERLELPAALQVKRILIVDDNQTNLDVLCGYLKLWGCKYDKAREGSSALSMMKDAWQVQAPYDLVITDMFMPGMDGALLGRKIKADPNLKNTILVMLTSQGMRGDAADMQKIGFAAYLTKPTRRSDLYKCLNTLFSPTKSFDDREQDGQIITRHSVEEDKIHQTRILIAEDNHTNRKLALHLLDRFGFTADAVKDGRTAVNALSERSYDLVLMDIQMPELDGLEATAIIRDPGSAVMDHEVPIIAMTAHAMKGDREKCLRSGMNDYIAKPIMPDLLLEAIQRCLPNR